MSEEFVARGLRLQRTQQVELMENALEVARTDLAAAFNSGDSETALVVQQLQQVLGAVGRGIAAAARIAAIDEALILTDDTEDD